MKKKTALVPKQNFNIVAQNPDDLLSPQLMKQLEDKLPEFIKEYERDGTAILRWNYEHLIIIEYLLREHFNFNDNQLVKLEKELKQIMPKVVGLKAETPLIITKEDYVGIADRAVQLNKLIQQRADSKIALPTEQELHKLKGK